MDHSLSPLDLVCSLSLQFANFFYPILLAWLMPLWLPVALMSPPQVSASLFVHFSLCFLSTFVTSVIMLAMLHGRGLLALHLPS